MSKTTSTSKADGVELAPVSANKTGPAKPRDDKDTAVAEGRVLQADQIADYHTSRPTLQPGPAHDPAVRDELYAKALRPLATAARKAADTDDGSKP